MASKYRCYLLDHNQVCSIEELECESDSAALLEAGRILTVSPFTAAEIWESGRKVSMVCRRSPPRIPTSKPATVLR